MKNRFSVQFTAQQTESLNRLAEELGASEVNVLKMALSLLTVAVREKNDGNQLCIVKDDKVLREVIGIFG